MIWYNYMILIDIIYDMICTIWSKFECSALRCQFWPMFPTSLTLGTPRRTAAKFRWPSSPMRGTSSSTCPAATPQAWLSVAEVGKHGGFLRFPEIGPQNPPFFIGFSMKPSSLTAGKWWNKLQVNCKMRETWWTFTNLNWDQDVDNLCFLLGFLESLETQHPTEKMDHFETGHVMSCSPSSMVFMMTMMTESFLRPKNCWRFAQTKKK